MTGPYQRSEIGLVTTSLLVPLLVLLFVSRIGSPYDMMTAAERKNTQSSRTNFVPTVLGNISALARPFCRCLKWTEVAHPTNNGQDTRTDQTEVSPQWAFWDWRSLSWSVVCVDGALCFVLPARLSALP